MEDTCVISRLEEALDSDYAFYIDYSRVKRHQKRVMKISTLVAEILGLSEKRMEYLRIAARLHDYSKRIWVPGMIFKKREKLDDYEKYLIATHPVASSNLIKNDLEIYDKYVADMFKQHYADVFKIIECHHENHDGSGYPFGLKEDDIPLEAAIIHVTDAYDAMRSPRIYRGVNYQLISHEEAIQKIKEKSGIEFHPEVVAALTKISKDTLEKIHEDVNHIPEDRMREMYGDDLSQIIRDN